MNKFKHHLFAALFFADDCPDGDAMFLSPEYKKWADEFETWKDTNEVYKFASVFIRQDCDNYISFVDNEQCIWFSDKLESCPWGKPVISCFWHSANTDIQYHEP